MAETIRLLIADDHPVVRHGLKEFLETHDDIDVVGEAEDGERAVQLAAELLPDIVLMDMLMPKMNGVEALNQIVEVSPATGVIILTSTTEDKYLFPAMQSGARGYLFKDTEPDEVLNAIRAAARGHATLHPSVAERLVKGAGKSDDGLADLSEREIDVLRLIARGLSNKEIARELVIAEGTVKSHVSNILSKLHLAHRTQAALFALRRNLVDLEDDSDV